VVRGWDGRWLVVKSEVLLGSLRRISYTNTFRVAYKRSGHRKRRQ
jgi:hypothetical protein